MAGLDAPRVHAQSSPPRPAVAITQMPRFYFATITADFNEDGHPDLIGAASNTSASPVAPDLVIAFGRGDGTFDAPHSLDVQALPLAIGDFNGDGHADVVIGGLAILPGRGDGTFGAPRAVDAAPGVSDFDEVSPRALAADFNHDGRLDFAVIDGANVFIYPGRDDLTFEPRVALSSSGDVQAIALADLNHDGRPDIAAATVSQRVDAFLNQGSLVFTVASTPVAGGLWDIAAGDLNGDGAPDLIVAASREDMDFGDGQYFVAIGNGDGTFQPAVAYPTGVKGALTTAVGDFNHDGLLDVAIGNRSWHFTDTSCSGLTYWDSVTIAPGAGDGTFGPPSTFRLGVTNASGELYRNTIDALTAVDLNKDGWTDLVTSPGAILLSHAAGPNRAPQVSAGPDERIEGNADTQFDALAIDADADWLEFVWRDGSGHVVGREPKFCAGTTVPGTLTVTLSDGHGGVATDSMSTFKVNDGDPFVDVQAPAAGEAVPTASPYTIHWTASSLAAVASLRVLSSADHGRTWFVVTGCGSLPPSATSCAWPNPRPVSQAALVQVEAYNSGGSRVSFGVSGEFQIVSGPLTSLPSGWQSADVGVVGEPGGATYDGTTFTVNGSGTDVWNTADEFQYAFTSFSGDFDIVAHVASVQNVDQWTKAGLMMREDLGAGARHAAVFVTPTTVKGIAFQRRPMTDGISVSTAGPSVTAPVWLRLSRVGNDVRAYWRGGATGAWMPIGTQTFANLNDDLQVGLAVSSHVHGALAAATFDHVAVSSGGSSPAWSSEDVGAVGATGTATVLDDGTATIAGSGADIWGTADAFHWIYQSVSGDFSIEARVDSVEDVNRWVKAGLMIRANHDPGSPHASLFATPTSEKGVAFQGRTTQGGASMQQYLLPRAPSIWIRLARQGTNVEAYFRESPADEWQNLGRIVLPGLPDTVLVGVAVSSHVDGTLATAHFSHIDVEPILPWTFAQGGPGTGEGFGDGTSFAVGNEGKDIWGAADDFGYVYTPWIGDGTITARLNDLRAVDPWTKGGVMFRESLAPGSTHAFALSSGEKGLVEQYRAATNGASASGGTLPGAPPIFDQSKPVWLRLTRAGNLFTSSISYDGVTFTPLGSATIVMPPAILVGLAVTSHADPMVGEAQGLFGDVTVR